MGGIVPVYLGAPDAPNITRTPSYVNAMHFRSPKELALYLLRLESHPDEYERYNAWRADPELFDAEYLRLVRRQLPGPEEMAPYHRFPLMLRRAACCRLCDPEFVAEAAARRTESDLVHPKWTPPKIDEHLFAGTMGKRPGPKARLDG